MNIKKEVEEIHKAGFIVNNLFEVEEGWQANITDKEKYYEFGRGATPSEALNNALHGRGSGVKAREEKKKIISTVAMDALIAGGL